MSCEIEWTTLCLVCPKFTAMISIRDSCFKGSFDEFVQTVDKIQIYNLSIFTSVLKMVFTYSLNWSFKSILYLRFCRTCKRAAENFRSFSYTGAFTQYNVWDNRWLQSCSVFWINRYTHLQQTYIKHNASSTNCG